jgi:hypothetical protein
VRVYVASAFRNKAAVRAAHATLRDAGHTITHDWTPEEEGGMSGDALSTYRARCAWEDVKGVESADVLVAINHDGACGPWWEGGIALGQRKPIVLITPPGVKPWTVFFGLPCVYQFDSLGDAMGTIEYLGSRLT